MDFFPDRDRKCMRSPQNPEIQNPSFPHAQAFDNYRNLHELLILVWLSNKINSFDAHMTSRRIEIGYTGLQKPDKFSPNSLFERHAHLNTV